MMNNSPTPEFDIQLNKALREASMMRSQGRNLEYIYNELNHLGFTPEIVNRVMNALTSDNQQVIKSHGNFEIVLGAIILIVGVGISVVSFILMSGSGSFILATGAIIAGIVFLVKGFMKRA